MPSDESLMRRTKLTIAGMVAGSLDGAAPEVAPDLLMEWLKKPHHKQQ
jgi:hypothetical protein